MCPRKSLEHNNLRTFFGTHLYVFSYAWEQNEGTLAPGLLYRPDRSSHDPLLLGSNHRVTLARRLLEPWRVEHFQPPPRVGQVTLLLQQPECNRHTRAPHAEHGCEEFVRERELVGAYAIACRQEPSLSSLL